MRLLKPFARIVNVSHPNHLRSINFYGRTCYKSPITSDPEKQSKFIKDRLDSGHESIIEHESVTVEIFCDRGVSHELVRHRLCAFSQESTRYVNYGNREIEFIIPCWSEIQEGIYENHQVALFVGEQELRWLAAMSYAEQFYKELIQNGWTPQQARSVLPNSLKTELIMTANLREWRHIFSLRCDKASHPQMREIMLPLLKDFYLAMPDFFFDLYDRFFGGACDKEESK